MKKLVLIYIVLLMPFMASAQAPGMPTFDYSAWWDRVQKKADETFKWTSHYLPMFNNIKQTKEDMAAYWKEYQRIQQDLRKIKDVADLRYMKLDDLAQYALYLAEEKTGMRRVFGDIPYAINIDSYMNGTVPTSANAKNFMKYLNFGSAFSNPARSMEDLIKYNNERVQKRYGVEMMLIQDRIQTAMTLKQTAKEYFKRAQELSAAINQQNRIGADPVQRIQAQAVAQDMLDKAVQMNLQASELLDKAMQGGEQESRANSSYQNKMLRKSLAAIKLNQ